jgi:cysteine desulfuration protein SufE
MLNEIRDTLGFFDNWEDKYRFIIDLGKQLPRMAPADKTEENLVRGCQSQVWLRCSRDPASGTLILDIDSDAHIVRGLIAILLATYQGQTPQYVRDFDVDGLFEELQLLQHLSPTRGNGLRAMIRRIKDEASR